MRKPNGYEVGAVLVIIVAFAGVIFLRLWRIADQAGVPVFSVAELAAAWPYLALMALAALVFLISVAKR